MTDNQFKRFGMPGDHALVHGARRARKQHLAMLQDIREGRRDKPMDTRAMGRIALSIPELDYYVLLQRFPDLGAIDSDTRHKAWKDFLKNPLSEQYRIRRKW